MAGYKVTRKNIMEAISKGKRLDGRGLFEQRPIEIKFGISNKAEGSVSVKFGKTEVVCGIKMDVSEPYPDHEDEGTMITSMELLPLASPEFEYGMPSIEAIEIARIVDRGIRESGFIDFKKLCIKEGEKVWSIFIDLATINDDGNLIDASALAAVLALLIARKPVYDKKKEKVSYGEFTDEKLPLNIEKMPLTITFFKIGEKVFIDPTREEENATEGRLTVELSKPESEKSELINAMQKGGESPFSIKEIENIVEEATKMFKKLKVLVDGEIEKFEKEKTEKSEGKKSKRKEKVEE